MSVIERPFFEGFLESINCQQVNDFSLLTFKGEPIEPSDIESTLLKIKKCRDQVFESRPHRAHNECGADANDLIDRLSSQEQIDSRLLVIQTEYSKLAIQALEIQAPWVLINNNPADHYISPCGDSYHNIVYAEIDGLETAIDINFSRRIEPKISGQIFIAQSKKALTTLVANRYFATTVFSTLPNTNWWEVLAKPLPDSIIQMYPENA